MSEISSAIKHICEEKGLSYEAVLGTIESALAAAYRKDFGQKNQNIVVEYEPDSNKSKVYDIKTVVEDMPEVEEKFDSSKKSALKKIAAQRITKSNIFWNYERLKRRGIDYDIRKDMYESIQNMTLQDLSTFFDQNVKQGEYTALVIGKKSDLDLNALKKMGDVKEMDIDYLFNYKDMEVKQ